MAMVWEQMGFIRWPIAFAVLMITALSLYSTAQVYKPGAWANLKTKVFIDAVLYWGGFALVAGILGSVVGLILAFQSVEMAGEVSPMLVAGGVKVATLSTATGLLVLAMASLIWFSLQFRWRMLHAREAQEES
jgi:MotA/TolQ/ExbB proton channel family protein